MSTVPSDDNQSSIKKQEDPNEEYNEDYKLCFNSKLILDVNKYPPPKRESVDSVEIKYSIDITTAPKKRLQEYLTSDLLDELENETSNPKEDDNTKIIPPPNNINKFDQKIQPNIPMPVVQMQKEGYQYQKKKKPFEIREGDWTCFDCHNLNFSFRIKCNRCGLLKEVSDKKYEDFRANVMSNMVNKNNGNYFNNNNNLYNNNMK